MKPVISIGMPVYNGQDYLAEAVESILQQTHHDWELLICDNASTDATQEMALDFARKESRIRYFRNELNLGAAANYNYAFTLAKGKYFKWAAHDDLCHPEFLEKCFQVLQDNASAVLCSSLVTVIDEEGNPVRQQPVTTMGNASAPHIRFRGVILIEPECNAVFGLIRSAALRRTPLIAKYIGSDQVLLAELSLKGQFHILQEHLFCRRDHPGISLRANKTYSDLTAWFDPTHRKNFFAPAWRLAYEYARTFSRVQLNPKEKMMCYRELCRWARRKRIALTRQFYHAARSFVQQQCFAS